MKNKILLCLLFLFSFHVIAQDKLIVPVTEIYIGRNFITNTDIRAKRYDFLENIYKWGIDDSSKLLTLQFRESMEDHSDLKDSGNIALVDFSTREMRWKKEVDFRTTTIDQYDNLMIKTDGNISSCLNVATGENIWSSKYTLCFINPHLRIGTGYSSLPDGGGINDIQGIDLITGKSLWKRKINKDFTLNEFIPLKDSMILFSANGLHLAQLKTGKGWDYNARTGKKDYSGSIAANIINLTFSILFGNDFEVTTGHDLISGVVSNTLVDSTGIYIADNRSITKVDYSGNEIWHNNLPKKLVSRSSLIFKDNMIVMVNEGSAMLNSELVKYGAPFIAAYEKNTGKPVFSNKVGYKNDQILSYEVQQDTLFLLSKNRIMKHSLIDGTELWERFFKSDTLGELTQFGGKELYMKMDSDTIAPVCSSPGSISVFNNKDQLFVLDGYLKTTTIIKDDQIYTCYLKLNGYNFLDDGISTVVTDRSNQPVATLDISGNSILIGSKLFEVQGKSLVVIDIDQFNH